MSLLEARALHKSYRIRGGHLWQRSEEVKAVNGVSLRVEEGRTLGLVGESGCGKSTLARTLMFLEPLSAGDILFRGEKLSPKDAERLRRSAQIVFQDPYSSLPPRMRVKSIVAEPLLIHGVAHGDELRRRVEELLSDVGLKSQVADSYPHQLSGGQRQRVGIARALAIRPAVIIADEAVSSLDVSVQAQILNLMRELQERHKLSYLFISHDLGVVRYMSHHIAVMYLGDIVELAESEELYRRPMHPYTSALMSATPSLERGRRRIRLEGEPPNPARPPAGCKFHPRCPMAQAVCREDAPPLKEWAPGRWSACHFAPDVESTLGRSTSDEGSAVPNQGDAVARAVHSDGSSKG